jgi:photosystem II stability/assembly factor-like uncharacterized protein
MSGKKLRNNRARIIFFLGFVLLLPAISVSQTPSPTFNWKTQEISKDNNLQGMSVIDENTAVIAGFGRTFRKTTDKGISWVDVGLLNPKYNFNDISIVDKVGYMVARKTLLVDNQNGAEDDVFVNGLLLKTIDGGKSWTVIDLSKIGDGTSPSLNPSLTGCITLTPYAVLCIDENTALVYLQWYEIVSGVKKTHSAIFKTKNGGEKWIAISPDLGSLYVTSMKLSGTDIFMGGNKILLKGSTSTDTTTDVFPEFSAVAGTNAFINEIRPFNTDEIDIITSTSGLLTTKDGGKTFSKINGITGGFDFFKYDEKVMVVMGTTSNSKATIDGGNTWFSCSTGKTGVEIPGIFNDSLYVLTSSPLLYKVAVNDIKSGKYNWVSKKLGEGTSGLQKMYRFDSNSALIIGDDQIARTTTDKGLSWSDAVLPELFVSGGKYDFRSVTSFGNAGFASTRLFKLIDYPTGEDYYTSGLIFKTEDAWKSWKVLNNKNIGKDTPNDASKYPLMAGCYGLDNYTIECIDGKTAYLNVNWFDTVTVAATVTKHSRVFKTIDGGDSWKPVTKDFGGTVITSIKFSGETGYISGNKILQKTSDGGNSFIDLYPKITLGTDSSLSINSIVLRNKDELYFQTSNNKGVFFTRDGGNTFSKLSGVTGGLDFVVLDNNSFMALGSSTSNKFTNDGGITWKDSKLTSVIYAAGKVFNDSLYVLGKSNVYKIAVTDLDISTSIPEIITSTALKVFYGPSAIRLECSAGDIQKCFIYNISGQLIAVSNPESSNYSIDYNLFTPGIYIISATVNGKKYTHKVVFK